MISSVTVLTLVCVGCGVSVKVKTTYPEKYTPEVRSQWQCCKCHPGKLCISKNAVSKPAVPQGGKKEERKMGVQLTNEQREVLITSLKIPTTWKKQLLEKIPTDTTVEDVVAAVEEHIDANVRTKSEGWDPEKKKAVMKKEVRAKIVRTLKKEFDIAVTLA